MKSTNVMVYQLYKYLNKNISIKLTLSLGNHIKQLNCKTNDSTNLWLIDGTLAIAAVWHRNEVIKDSGLHFTSALIKTEKAFSSSRIEIRASLPKGKLLRPAFVLVPTENTGIWPKDGQIDIMTYSQTKSLGNGLHVVRQYNQYLDGSEYTTGAKLNEFHSYIVEWNESMVVWKFDQDTRLAINLTEELDGFYNPFTKPFKLVITLGVGGKDFFTDTSIDEEVVRKWNCSALILDYIRVYRWVSDGSIVDGLDFNMTRREDRVSSFHICEEIMSKIRPSTELSLSVSFSILAIIMLLILISIIVFLFYRQKSLRQNIPGIEHDSYYDDYQNNDAYYETVKDNEYEDPYQSNKDNDYIDPNNKNSEYLQMTNKYVSNP